MRIFVLFVLLLFIPAAFAQQPSNLLSLLEDGHFKRARTIADQRIRQNPKDAEALYAMGKIRQAYNDREGAHSFAERAVAADGSKAAYRCLLGEAAGNKAQRAGTFSKFGLARTVKKEAEAGIQAEPKFAGCYHLLIVFHLQAPGMVGGDKKKAQELADKLMSIDPVEGNFAQARIASSEKKTEKLAGFYAAALQASPKNYWANLQMANVYAGQKKFDLAEKHAKEAMKIEPTRIGSYSMLVQTAVMQAKWTELDTVLAQAEKAVPDNLNPYYQAARVSLAEGKELARAEKYLRKYLTQEPEGGAPSWANAHWRLGLVFEKMGRKADAQQELRIAVSLDPELEPAKKDLERLK
ncbi:MAG TPA: hypothetical protein VM056_01900 [Terriglobales bacterium]|nr:hypothetical protein [Terriglobales bacterium]